ncbi:MAG: hypothetical protein NDI69_02865 [Bacteriovoracaceae bacterium]|nr:hypothetical protein [Bacteriovoracaceae bacterium]
MKTITHIFFVLIFLSTAHAGIDTAQQRSNGLLQFIASQEGLRNIALSTIIVNRCKRYMSYSDRGPCKEAVKKMIELLDYDIIISDKKIPASRNNNWTPSSFVFVAFKTNLISLLNHPRTAAYLKDLNQQLYDFLTGAKSDLNIWDVTLKHFKSPYMTAMVMATLFQDTSIKKLHLAFLDRSSVRGSALYQSNKEMVSRVIDTINLILDVSDDNYRKIFYPKEIVPHVNRNIYHFYVPLFLSMSLNREGISPQFSYTAPLMLTLSYEFITSSNDYRYLLQDPEVITSLGKVKDIFGGYCGANIGIRGMNFYKSFEIIKESFARSTEDSVELLLRH